MKSLLLILGAVFCFAVFSVSAGALELPPPPATKTIIHTVKKGEQLHVLAGYYYGDCRQWVRIYNNNSYQIKNKNLIYPGQQFAIVVDENWVPPFDLDEFIKTYHP